MYVCVTGELVSLEMYGKDFEINERACSNKCTQTPMLYKTFLYSYSVLYIYFLALYFLQYFPVLKTHTHTYILVQIKC